MLQPEPRHNCPMPAILLVILFKARGEACLGESRGAKLCLERYAWQAFEYF